MRWSPEPFATKRDRPSVCPARGLPWPVLLSQVVRIPAHLRLPASVKAVEVPACGQERIISPVGQCWDSSFHHSSAIPDHFIAEHPSQEQTEHEAF